MKKASPLLKVRFLAVCVRIYQKQKKADKWRNIALTRSKGFSFIQFAVRFSTNAVLQAVT